MRLENTLQRLTGLKTSECAPEGRPHGSMASPDRITLETVRELLGMVKLRKINSAAAGDTFYGFFRKP
jgi:hypothetical protein